MQNQGLADLDIINSVFTGRVIVKGDKEVVLGDKAQLQLQDDDMFGTKEDQGDKFGAVKPWKGALGGPPLKPQDKLPSLRLVLQHVNGINSLQLSQMVFYQSNPNNIVYPAALLGVKMNKHDRQQLFFGGGTFQESQAYHSDDIVSLDYVASLDLCASGSIGKNPEICIWQPSTMKLIKKIKQGVDTRAVSTIRLSKDGKYVFTTCRSQKVMLRTFSLSDGKKLDQDPMPSHVIQMAVSQTGKIGLVCQKQFLVFSMSGTDNKKQKKQAGSFTAIAFDGNDSIIASVTGQLQRKSTTKKVHQGVIFAVTCKDKKVFSSGSQDCLLKVSDLDFTVLQEIKLQSFAKSIDVCENSILVCLRNGKIIEVFGQEVKQIMNGHFAGQVWGLASDGKGIAISSADDNKVICFDYNQKKTINQIAVSHQDKKGLKKASTLSPFAQSKQARALAFNSNGNIAVANNVGQVTLYSSIEAAQPLCKVQVSKDWIEVMKFSPDGETLAVGSHDRKIYLLSSGDLQLKAKCKGNVSFITGIDWAKNSQYIRTVSGDYQLLYFDLKGSQITHTPDTEWQTVSRFDRATQFLWTEIIDGSFVNTMALHPSKKYIAVGQDDGCIRIYRYPIAPRKCNKFKSHSSHVVRVQWVEDGQKLLSVGGYDKTLMVWRTVK